MFDWIVVGPVWAAVAYLGQTRLAHAHSRWRGAPMAAALAAWLVMGSVLSWWQGYVYQLREKLNHPSPAELKHEQP